MVEYCIDCEIEIKMPNPLVNFMGGGEEPPTKYKSGWRCYRCAKAFNEQ